VDGPDDDDDDELPGVELDPVEPDPVELAVTEFCPMHDASLDGLGWTMAAPEGIVAPVVKSWITKVSPVLARISHFHVTELPV